MRVRWVPVVVAPALVLLLWWSLVFGGGRSGGGRSGCSLCYFANVSKMGSAPTYAPTHPRTHIRTYTHTRAIIFRRAIFRLCTEIFR